MQLCIFIWLCVRVFMSIRKFLVADDILFAILYILINCILGIVINRSQKSISKRTDYKVIVQTCSNHNRLSELRYAVRGFMYSDLKATIRFNRFLDICWALLSYWSPNIDFNMYINIFLKGSSFENVFYLRACVESKTNVVGLSQSLNQIYRHLDLYMITLLFIIHITRYESLLSGIFYFGQWYNTFRYKLKSSIGHLVI